MIILIVFGTCISLDETGHTIAIGDPSNYTQGTGIGKVKVYEWNNNISSWIQKGNDILGFTGDGFGNTVVLSNDGNTVAIGSPHNNDSYSFAGKNSSI